MSVHKRESERGPVRFEVMWRSPQHGKRCRPGCDKRVHQLSKTFDNRRDAERWDDRMLTATASMRDAGHTVGVLPERPGSVRTFRQIAADVIARMERRGDWARSTSVHMRVSLRKLGAWADQPIGMAADDLRGAQSTVDSLRYPKPAVSLIRHTMDYAVRESDIATHRMAGLEIARGARTASKRRDYIPVSEAQLDSIVAAMDAWRPGAGTAVLLMRRCGLRISEALAVRADDFRDNCSVLNVARQDDNGRDVPLKGKRDDESRDVPVCASLAARITATDRVGRLVRANRSMFGAALKDAARDAGVPGAWTAHQLRHQFATSLLSTGRVSLETVAKLLGHASVSVTYSYYFHVIPAKHDDVREILEAA